MSDLFTQPMTIAALVFPLLVAFLIYFKSGADRWWWVGLFLGAVVFWGFIVLANRLLEDDLTKAAQAVLGEAEEAEPRSNFNTYFIKSYGFAIGLALTGLYYGLFTIIRRVSRSVAR